MFQFYCLVLINRRRCWKKGIIKTFVGWRALFRVTLQGRPSHNATLGIIRDIGTILVLPLHNFQLGETQSSLSPSTHRHPMWIRSSPHSQNESNQFWPITCSLQDYVCCIGSRLRHHSCPQRVYHLLVKLRHKKPEKSNSNKESKIQVQDDTREDGSHDNTWPSDAFTDFL